METADVFGEKLREFLQQNLRGSYTYMKHDVVNGLAQHYESQIIQSVAKEMPRMQASYARANLTTLPAELRNRIYHLVLVADDGIKRPDGRYMIEIAGYDQDMPSYESTPIWCKQPALTRVSRHIRRETLPVYYGSNIFVVYVEEVGFLDNSELVQALYLCNAHMWLINMPGESRQMLKDLHVRFCPNIVGSGLTSDTMAEVLSTLGIDVPKGAITTWTAPKKSLPGRGELEKWKQVLNAEGSRNETIDALVQLGLEQDVEQIPPDLLFNWA